MSNELTEGDVVTIFSQYGEPVDVNLPRDKQTGKSRGFGFVMYENQKSTILAVDNLNGAKVLGRTLRVDHVSKYKHLEKGDDGKYKEAEMESMNARPELFISKSHCTDAATAWLRHIIRQIRRQRVILNPKQKMTSWTASIQMTQWLPISSSNARKSVL